MSVGSRVDRRERGRETGGEGGAGTKFLTVVTYKNTGNLCQCSTFHIILQQACHCDRSEVTPGVAAASEARNT